MQLFGVIKHPSRFQSSSDRFFLGWAVTFLEFRNCKLLLLLLKDVLSYPSVACDQISFVEVVHLEETVNLRINKLVESIRAVQAGAVLVFELRDNQVFQLHSLLDFLLRNIAINHIFLIVRTENFVWLRNIVILVPFHAERTSEDRDRFHFEILRLHLADWWLFLLCLWCLVKAIWNVFMLHF